MFSRKSLAAAAFAVALAASVVAFPGDAAAQGITIPTPTDEPSPGEPDPEPTDDNGGQPNPTSEPGPTDAPNPTSQPNPTSGPPPVTAPPASATSTPIGAGPTASATTTGPSATPFASATATAFNVVPGVTRGTIEPAAPGTVSAPPLAGTATPAGTVLEGAVLAFPEGSLNYPEAGPCDLPPTYTANDSMTVFVGPGSEYPLAGLLGLGEIRPIVGRAAFNAWWVVQLDGSGRAGWVRDELGSVNGYIRRVPILSAPALNGVLPTPGGSPWVPTPQAACSAPQIASAAAVDAAPGQDVEPPSGRPDSLEGLEDSAANGAQSEVEGGSQPLVELPDDVDDNDIVLLTEGSVSSPSLAGELAQSAAPLELPASQGQQLPGLMPVVGTLLIAAALLVGLFALRRGSSGEES